MKWGKKGIEEIREDQRRASDERRKNAERIQAKLKAEQRAREDAAKAINDRANRFKTIDVESALAAARRLRFRDLESHTIGSAFGLNRPSLELVSHFLSVLRNDRSSSILQWPYAQRDITLLHPIAMLSLLGAPPVIEKNRVAWCSAVRDFRTLYFPWRGNATGSNLRDVLVNRHELLEHNKFHLTRPLANEPEATHEMREFHVTLGHLNRLKQRDTSKPNLAHPNLYEIFPLFGAIGGEDAPPPFSEVVNTLYGRVEHGAGLKELTDNRGMFTQPATAPFGFFGICPRADVKRALKAACFAEVDERGRAPDICILDLGPPGIARLGADWEDRVEDFIAELDRLHPTTPILAATHDIYVHRRLFAMLKRRELMLSDVTSSIVTRSTDGPLDHDPAWGTVSPVSFLFNSTAGEGAEAVKSMSAAANGLDDPSMAGRVRRKIGDLRRAMSLPCGLNHAYTFFLESEGQTAADDFLQYRSASGIVAVLREAAEQCPSQGERQRLEAAEAAVNSAFDGFENDTPIGSLISELASVLSRRSSRSVIAFATERDRKLGLHRITSDPDGGTGVQRRFDDGYMRVTTCIDLDSVLNAIENEPQRNHWKRLVLVSPSLEQLSVILGRKWLPDELTVVADREFVSRLAATYRVLSQHPDLAGADKIGVRLAAAAAKARAEADARAVPAIDLELESHRSADRDETVIDLLNLDDDDDDGEVVELYLESGRVVRARPGALVIRHDANAEVNPFEKATARSIGVGEAMVVPDHAFIADARSVLPVQVLAQGWVEIYHASVEAGLSRLNGDNWLAKARCVQERMGRAAARQMVPQTIVDWLKVAEHKKVSKERLRPHAPQRRREFNAFATIVGIEANLADKIWREGIETLRIDRRRAGARMAQAFVSVLVDPHGSASILSPDLKARIGALRIRAREHLDGVVAKKNLAGRRTFA